MNIKITEDTDSEMTKIERDGECVFEGNYWDLNTDGGSLECLFGKMGLKVELIEKDYEDWYENA